MKYCLITGASGGIGYELAVLFAKNGCNVILVARDEEKLKQVSDYLENTFKIQTHIIPIDLSQPDAADEIFKKVGELSIMVDSLVNNAGFYVKGGFSETPWENEQQLIQIQCLTQARMIKLFLPGMIHQGRGRILNVGSTGSFVPGPYNAVYCAAKSFILSLSEAVAEEASETGVTVTALCPGATNTDFWKGVGRKGSILFPIMDVKQVAEAGYKGLMKGKRLVIPGKVNKLNVFLTRFIPRKMMAEFSGRITRNH